MIRRALWIGGATLVFMACGPMPGYMAPSERPVPEKSTRSSVEYTSPKDDDSASDDRAGSDDDEGRYAPPDDSATTRRKPPTVLRDRSTPTMPPAPREPAPTVTPEAPPVTAPTPASAAPAPSSSKLQVVPLDRADTYYLIDRERGLCFFIHKETSAKVDCAIIPEGRDVAQPAPAVTPAPKSDEGVRRRYVEPEPAPTAPPRRVTAPAPAPAPASDPNGPTADELNRFESAYVEIACDRRQGSFTPPHARIDEAGLSQERYNAIEGWLTADERAWRLLVNRAYRECDARK